MYAGVPTVDLGWESKTADLEYPKSQIFRRGAGRPSRSVFSSFRSLWHTPCMHPFDFGLQMQRCLGSLHRSGRVISAATKHYLQTCSYNREPL